MKVFFINTNQAWGGGEKWHFDTAYALKNYGHEVAIITRGDTPLTRKSEFAGITTIPVRITRLSFLNPFVIFSLMRFFKSRKPDVVILNLSSDVKTAGVAAKAAGIKHIIYRRGNAKPVRNSFTNRIIFRKIITGLIANSEETKRSLLKNNDRLFPSQRIKVLYNGIDLERFDSLSPIHLFHRKDGSILLGSAGRLSPEKGHEFLVEMGLQLMQRKLPFVLLIAGEGPLKDSLMQKFRDSGLGEKVIFTGFIENMKSFMETIDVFILPSLWEGFGYVSIEAMACSKPVVAFHTGSNPEIIEDKKTGFLVSCYDTVDLAGKVSILMNDPELRQSFGKAGREKVEKIFNSKFTDKMTIQYLEELTR